MFLISFFIQFYNLYERLDIEISIYAWVQNAHLWLFILWTAFFGLHFEWGFLFSSSILYGFLRKQICKAKQRNNKYVISIMSKRKISLNDRMKSYSLWFDKKSGVCFKSAIYHIKNNFQKFVISYENEFRDSQILK